MKLAENYRKFCEKLTPNQRGHRYVKSGKVHTLFSHTKHTFRKFFISINTFGSGKFCLKRVCNVSDGSEWLV